LLLLLFSNIINFFIIKQSGSNIRSEA